MKGTRLWYVTRQRNIIKRFKNNTQFLNSLKFIQDLFPIWLLLQKKKIKLLHKKMTDQASHLCGFADSQQLPHICGVLGVVRYKCTFYLHLHIIVAIFLLYTNPSTPLFFVNIFLLLIRSFIIFKFNTYIQFICSTRGKYWRYHRFTEKLR